MRRLLILVLVLAVAAPAEGASRDRNPQLQQMLDSRAGAVASKDAKRFLETVDPMAQQFLAAQEAWFENLRPVPLDEYGLRLDVDDAPELTRSRDVEAWGKGTVVAHVEERLKVADFDVVSRLNDLFLTFVQRGDRWYVAADSALDDLGIPSARSPWDFGPVELHRRGNILMVTHPSDSSSAAALLPLAEQAVVNMEAIWRADWRRRVVFYLPASLGELERTLDVTFDLGPFVAVADSSLDRSNGWEPLASRIILHRANFIRHTEASRRSIFSHELLHVATWPASGPFIPVFVEEGLAQVGETGRPPSVKGALRGRQTTQQIPEDVEFTTGGATAVNDAYHRALTAIGYIAERFSVAKLNDFYTRLGAARLEPGTPRFHVDRVLVEVFGISFEQFEADWRNFVR